MEFTDLPPRAKSWPTLAEAGEDMENFDLRPSHRLTFEQFDGNWICEVIHQGLRQGWLRNFIVRAGRPVFTPPEES